MILFITDLHCRYEVVNRQIEDAEARFGQAVTQAVVLGDFGVMEPFMRRFLGKGRPGFLRPLSFIEGNHEDFTNFDKLVRRYENRLTYLPRGSCETIKGWSLLAIGGAAYMDAHTTPERCVIKPRDIEQCLSHPADSVDIVISHDCPRELGIGNAPGFEHYGETGFEGGDRIVQHLGPRYWLFGHHHRVFQKQVGETYYVGLPQSWAGYAVLLGNSQLELVENRVPKDLPPSRFKQLLHKLVGKG